MSTEPEQLDLAALLGRGAAELLATAPPCPELALRMRRVLGERLPCRAVIHWLCPRCGARSRTDHRCGPRCPTCRRERGPRAEAMLRQIPPVPVRHWGLTLPRPQRFDLAGDPRLEAKIARAFVGAIFRHLRAGARAGAGDGACGALVVVHRCGSALDLNLHLHAVVVDGVFLGGAGEPRFLAHGGGVDADVNANESSGVSGATSTTASASVDAHANANTHNNENAQTLDVAASPDDLLPVLEEMRAWLANCPNPAPPAPALAAVRAAARRRPAAMRVRSATRPPRAGDAVEASGLRVFRGPAIGADDRGRLRSLCEYLARPPSARLVVDAASTSRVSLRLPPQPDGSTIAALSAPALAARLVAATPAGPAVSTRTFGVLAPRAAHLWQQMRGAQLELDGFPSVDATPRATDGGESSAPSRAPRAPRCRRCAAPLRALEVEDEADLGVLPRRARAAEGPPAPEGAHPGARAAR